MCPVNNNYFNYTDTSINSLEVDSLSDSIIQCRIYTTLNIKIGHLGNFFSYIKCIKTDFLANRKAKHIGGPSGKVSKIRGNTPRSGDITCMASHIYLISRLWYNHSMVSYTSKHIYEHIK